jgi:hypothetical protein
MKNRRKRNGWAALANQMADLGKRDICIELFELFCFLLVIKKNDGKVK